MNGRKDFVNVLVIGFALFATFFGAGNLIFPPIVGFSSGSEWIMSALGFFITAAVIPVLGVIVAAKHGGFDVLGNYVHPHFSKIFMTICMLMAGCIIGVPRIGAVVHELGISPLFPEVPQAATSLVFFGISLYLAFNAEAAIDRIGKYLTPVLVVVLALVIVLGIFSHEGGISQTDIKNPFSAAFIQGYQTGDALGAVVVASVFFQAVLSKGYTDKKKHFSILLKACILAGISLVLVYGGLLYIGATGAGKYPIDIEQTQLFTSLVESSLGKMGLVAFSVTIVFACLTTTVGFITAVGNYFSDLLHNKISYKNMAIGITVLGFFLSIIGVAGIIELALPIFLMIYPVAIVLILIGIFKMSRTNVYRYAVFFTLPISILDTLLSMNVNLGFINGIFSKLPFYGTGMTWVTFAVIGAIFGFFMPNSTANQRQ